MIDKDKVRMAMEHVGLLPDWRDEMVDRVAKIIEHYNTPPTGAGGGLYPSIDRAAAMAASEAWREEYRITRTCPMVRAQFEGAENETNT